MWDLPGPGLERLSPALAGRFLTTAPPGKPHTYFLFWLFLNYFPIWVTTLSSCHFSLLSITFFSVRSLFPKPFPGQWAFRVSAGCWRACLCHVAGVGKLDQGRQRSLKGLVSSTHSDRHSAGVEVWDSKDPSVSQIALQVSNLRGNKSPPSLSI